MIATTDTAAGVRSPLTHGSNILLERSISCQWIIERYRRDLSIDVRPLLDGVEEIGIYRCLDSGYRFYSPFHAAGDEAFYAQLQEFDWYYMPWKWEHRQAARHVRSGMKVLEVGCGKGGFLEGIAGMQVDAVGLELNGSAAGEGIRKGLDIRVESVEEHATAFPEHYDIVCSFQVLEHIADVRSFLDAQLRCLKPGGMLIVSVPNNDSFLGLDRNILNLPPHHMGLWNGASLGKLTALFPLHLVALDLEPLQEYHREYFLDVMSRHYSRRFSLPLRSTRRMLPKLVRLLPASLKAFTIQAVFRTTGATR
jgi:2-polyprenyl-3-methyl-5-hydroxy-6-metoxy-1,4-benzoquinol methylase